MTVRAENLAGEQRRRAAVRVAASKTRPPVGRGV
jgi:hypothetical protein